MASKKKATKKVIKKPKSDGVLGLSALTDEEWGKLNSPENIIKLRDAFLKHQEEQRKDDDDWISLRGKYDPKENPLGTCVACKGDVIAKISRQYNGDSVHLTYSPFIYKSDYSTIHDGYYCKSCGLKYVFPPPSTMKKKDNG